MIGVVGSVVGAGCAGGLGVLAHGAFHPRSRLFGEVLWRGSEEGMVALTFDDGPTPGITDAILDRLGEAGARGTFFVIGRHVVRHPELVRRAHAEGHVIGNHTMDHHRHGLFHRDAYWREQVAACGRVVEEVIGCKARVFRPPMGFRSAHVMRAARADGCVTVTWSRRGLDRRGSAERVAGRVLSGLGAGEIVALHDGVDGDGRRPPTAAPESAALILDGLAKRGLRSVGVDEVLGLGVHGRRDTDPA